MKPFGLEAAMRGEPICTRDGQPAKFIAFVPEASEEQQLIVLIGTNIWRLYPDGRVHQGESQRSSDLFMAPKKRTVWINLYEHSSALDSYDAFVYDSEEMANNARSADRIGGKAWPLEIEE